MGLEVGGSNPLVYPIRSNLLLHSNKKPIKYEVLTDKKSRIGSLYYSSGALFNLLNRREHFNMNLSPQLVHIFIRGVRKADNKHGLKSTYTKTFKHFNGKYTRLQKPISNVQQNFTTIHSLLSATTPKYTYSNKENIKNKLVTSFTLYMQVNYTSNLSPIRTHMSAHKHYFHFTKQGLTIENVHKLFQK